MHNLPPPLSKNPLFFKILKSMILFGTNHLESKILIKSSKMKKGVKKGKRGKTGKKENRLKLQIQVLEKIKIQNKILKSFDSQYLMSDSLTREPGWGRIEVLEAVVHGEVSSGALYTSAIPVPEFSTLEEK